MIRLLFISLVFISCNGNKSQSAQIVAQSYAEQLEQMPSDSLLIDIQHKINNAFVQSIMAKDDHPLKNLRTELVEYGKNRKQPIITYWRAYLQFYYSIYYLKTKDKENAERQIEKGIDLLEEMKKKNAEDHALLAMLQSFSIQFNTVKAMFISMDVKDNAHLAIAMDSTNLRGYYVSASNDFYTPEQFGGGKKAEELLLKAISLPAQKIKNPYLPSWGKEESYELLVKLYIKNEKWELAKKYYKEGMEEFPESFTINQLAPKLMDH